MGLEASTDIQQMRQFSIGVSDEWVAQKTQFSTPFSTKKNEHNWTKARLCLSEIKSFKRRGSRLDENQFSARCLP